MVHSKVVLIDPFGNHPVLMTGSHNLGPKASGTNDENLLIIRGRARPRSGLRDLQCASLSRMKSRTRGMICSRHLRPLKMP